MALPSATPLALTGNPYSLFSKEVVYVVPAIATITAPTLVELNAGKDITKHITGMSGFELSVGTIEVPRAGTPFTGSVPGRQTAADSSLTFINSDGGPVADVRSQATLALGATGFLVFFNEGLVASGAMDVWPYRVSSVSPSRDLEGLATTVISFTIPIVPALFVAIPSA